MFAEEIAIRAVCHAVTFTIRYGNLRPRVLLCNPSRISYAILSNSGLLRLSQIWAKVFESFHQFNGKCVILPVVLLVVKSMCLTPRLKSNLDLDRVDPVKLFQRGRGATSSRDQTCGPCFNRLHHTPASQPSSSIRCSNTHYQTI